MNIAYKKVLNVIMAAGITILGACGSSGDGGSGSGCGSAGSSCMTVAGTWYTNEQVNAGACGSGSYTDYMVYTVTQSGCTITVMPNTGGTFNGIVNGSQICWSGSYSDNGGTTTITSLNLTVDQSGDSLHGSSNWAWSDGSYSCSGSTQVTGTKS